MTDLPPDAPTQSVTLRIDQTDLRTTYVNAFHASVGQGEVVVDLGFQRVAHALSVNSEMAAKPELHLTLAHRAITTFPTLKRLAIAISRIVREHEIEHGEIILPEHAKQQASSVQ